MLAAVCVLGSCSDDEGGADASDSGGQLVAPQVHGPGTELGDGFTVAEGSVLIGDVFPVVVVDPPSGAPPGWIADLYVTGDIGKVLERYRRQAERAGVPISSASGGCETFDNEFVHCRFDGFGETSERPQELEIRVDYGTLNGAAVSHVGLRFTEPKRQSPFAPPADSQPARKLDVPSLAEPSAPPATPSPGERVGPTFGEEGARFRVEEGTTLIAPVHLESTADDGFQMIATVDSGEVAAVAESYRDQATRVLPGLDEWGTGSTTTPRGTSQRWVLNTGRGGFEVQTLEPDEERPLVRVRFNYGV